MNEEKIVKKFEIWLEDGTVLEEPVEFVSEEDRTDLLIDVGTTKDITIDRPGIHQEIDSEEISTVFKEIGDRNSEEAFGVRKCYSHHLFDAVDDILDRRNA